MMHNTSSTEVLDNICSTKKTLFQHFQRASTLSCPCLRVMRGLSPIKLETVFKLDNNNERAKGHQWKLKKRQCNTIRQHFFSIEMDKHVVSATRLRTSYRKWETMMSRHFVSVWRINCGGLAWAPLAWARGGALAPTWKR